MVPETVRKAKFFCLNSVVDFWAEPWHRGSLHFSHHHIGKSANIRQLYIAPLFPDLNTSCDMPMFCLFHTNGALCVTNP